MTANRNGLRILIPIHAFDPGGVERVGLKLADRWARSGHDVRILLGRDRGLCRSDRPNLRYVRYHEWLPTEWWETLWMTICLLRELWRREADIIFCPGLTYTAPCVVARILLPKRCCPVVVKISNDLLRTEIGGPFRVFYEAWLAIQGRWLTHFVAIAEPMLDTSRKLLRIDERKASTIFDPALSGEAHSELSSIGRARSKDATRYLAVGRLVPQKDFGRLLNAFAQCSKPGDTLIIAGEGPERTKLVRQSRTLGIASSVQFLGHVNSMHKLYEDCDVLVVSSRYEGMPAVVIEALAAGLPIASTNCCESIGWIMDHGNFGYLARRDDAEDLANAMTIASQCEPSFDAMRSLAALFTLERADAQYVALFERVCREEKFT